MKATSIYLAKALSILVGEEEAFIFINNGMRATEKQEIFHHSKTSRVCTKNKSKL